MKAEFWPEVEAIVAEALELPPSERSRFVARACAQRPEIAADVHSLLQADAEAGDFLQCRTLSPADVSEPADAPVSARVGPYRLMGEVGHGGMSIVYRAERDDGQFRKQAAVKLLATGWISPEAKRRFLAERQILASLDHPNICGLLDGGVTDSGAPYLVMEFVDGVRLLDYCRQNELSEPARLELFRRICQAVQYAHQNLIVHRDIKPGNVMVTHDGEVRLMDFGIAKILAESVLGEQTQTAFAALTPDYASPEQVRGQPITTQSDIYSLGVLLYELLTGQRPYTASGKGLQELLETVSRAEAPPAPGLSTELLAIVRCAMAKEPRDRYAAASALDDDVRRYLTGLPVRAVTPARWYTFRKWLRRHRAPALAGTAAAVLILASSAFAWRSAVIARRERAVAEQRFHDVRRLARKVLFEYPGQLWQIGAATDLQVRMASDSLEYLDSLARAKSSDPTLSLELADGYIKVGRLLGRGTNPSLGDQPRASETFRKARAIIDDILKRDPDSRPARMKLATLLSEWSASDKKNALDLARQAVSLWQDLCRQSPDNASLNGLTRAQVLLALQGYDLGEARRAVELSEGYVARGPTDPVTWGTLALAHRRMAWALLRHDNADGARSEALRAQEMDDKARVLARNPAANRMETSFDLLLIGISDLQARQYSRALGFFHQVSEIRRTVFAANRGDAWVQSNLLEALGWEGWAAESDGKWTVARPLYQEAANLAHTLAAARADAGSKPLLGFVYGSQAVMAKRADRRTDACELFARAAEYYRAGDPDPDLGPGRRSEVQRELTACQKATGTAAH